MSRCIVYMSVVRMQVLWSGVYAKTGWAFNSFLFFYFIFIFFMLYGRDYLKHKNRYYLDVICPKGWHSNSSFLILLIFVYFWFPELLTKVSIAHWVNVPGLVISSITIECYDHSDVKNLFWDLNVASLFSLKGIRNCCYWHQKAQRCRIVHRGVSGILSKERTSTNKRDQWCKSW